MGDDEMYGISTLVCKHMQFFCGQRVKTQWRGGGKIVVVGDLMAEGLMTRGGSMRILMTREYIGGMYGMYGRRILTLTFCFLEYICLRRPSRKSKHSDEMW